MLNMVADIPPALMQAKRTKMRNIDWKTVDKQKRSTDSGIFSRSISEKNDDSSTLNDSIDSRLGSILIVNKKDMDCDMNQHLNCSSSDNKTSSNSSNNKHLTKKSSKDSGIDCRTISESISSDAAKEFLQSTNHLAPENSNSDDDDEQFSSLPDEINRIPNQYHATVEQQSIIIIDSNQNNTQSSSNSSKSSNSMSQQVASIKGATEKVLEPTKLLLDNNNTKDIIEPTEVPHDTTTTTAEQLDDFHIDPKLINRTDGLKRSYFVTDENGSPKILEEIIEREIERKNKKKNMTDGSVDPDLFGCLGFSKLSKIFKTTRK